MIGERVAMQDSLLYECRLEEHVPADHQLRLVLRNTRTSWGFDRLLEAGTTALRRSLSSGRRQRMCQAERQIG
jgi:hypothetical protein